MITLNTDKKFTRETFQEELKALNLPGYKGYRITTRRVDEDGKVIFDEATGKPKIFPRQITIKCGDCTAAEEQAVLDVIDNHVEKTQEEIDAEALLEEAFHARLKTIAGGGYGTPGEQASIIFDAMKATDGTDTEKVVAGIMAAYNYTATVKSTHDKP